LKDELMPVTICMLPGVQSYPYIRKGPVSSEMLGMAVSIGLVPGGGLVIKNAANSVLVRFDCALAASPARNTMTIAMVFI
jgi:hypothetical protein